MGTPAPFLIFPFIAAQKRPMKADKNNNFMPQFMPQNAD